MLLRFLPQTVLDGWVDQAKVDLQPGHLVELATRMEYPAREAVRFVGVDSGADARGWVDSVRSLEEIRAAGAEHLATSVILGETVYSVEQGWLVEESDAAAGPKAGRKGDGKSAGADALAQLLVDKLS